MMIYSLGITTLALLAATQVLAAYMPVYELISRDFGGVLGTGGSAWGGSPTGDFMESLLRLQFWLVKWRWWIAFLPSGAVLLLWVISKGMPLGSLVRYVPCIGSAIYWREFSRCVRLLAQFLWAGVTYPRALHLAGRGSRGLSVRLSCQALSKRLSEGVPIREAVLSAESMPDSMTETLVGVEEQGAVCRMLRSLGDLYERRSREAMQWFLLIWEPCVMVLVLGIVGTTLLFLYPLLQVIRAFY